MRLPRQPFGRNALTHELLMRIQHFGLLCPAISSAYIRRYLLSKLDLCSGQQKTLLARVLTNARPQPGKAQKPTRTPISAANALSLPSTSSFAATSASIFAVSCARRSLIESC